MVRKLYFRGVMPTHSPAARSLENETARFFQGAFWLISACLLGLWAFLSGAELIAHAAQRATSIDLLVVRHSGAIALIATLMILALASLVASILTFFSKSIPEPTGSVLLITACGLRAVELLSIGSMGVTDANILGGLLFAAALIYKGPYRLWWTVLMPLGTLAAFVPMVWLEYLKGAQTKTVIDALIVPGAAFAAGSLIVIIRELRSRAVGNVVELRRLQKRGDASIQALRTMEADMKTLTSALARTSRQIFIPEDQTTEFSSLNNAVHLKEALQDASQATSFGDIDSMIREILEDVRHSNAGAGVRLTLTSPSSAKGLPIAVRGDLSVLRGWFTIAISASLKSLGGYPGGVVRVGLRSERSLVAITIEDNGRGISEISPMEIRQGVEAIGGRFELHARLGVGCRLTFELPRVDAMAMAPRNNMLKRGFDPLQSNSPRA